MGFCTQVPRFQWIVGAALLAVLTGWNASHSGESDAARGADTTVDIAVREGVGSAVRLQRCTEVAAEDREHARCPHSHVRVPTSWCEKTQW